MKHSPKYEDKAKHFALQAHSETNHYYDDYLPYEFHLRMVVQAAKDFKEVGEDVCKSYFNSLALYNLSFSDLIDGAWLHDTMEDTRTNYNDLLRLYNPTTKDFSSPTLDRKVAEITRAVTNYNRGRNRDERMPDFVYEDIRNTPGATFVKLCDRIANAQYSKLTKSSMFKKYDKENPHFLSKLQGHELEICKPMVNYLNNLFND